MSSPVSGFARAGGTGFDSVVAPNHKLATDRGNLVNALSDAEMARWAKVAKDAGIQPE